MDATRAAVMAPEQPPAWAHCPACWYDLRGLRIVNGRGRCPECGARFRIVLHRKERSRAERRHARVGSARDWWAWCRPSAWAAAVWFFVGGAGAGIVAIGLLAALRFTGVLDRWGW